ncbi:J domain-containing protein [Methylotuvimicrobium alcaliphilum]|uniref:Heat shock protein DnaJ domain protein n=1 Tax=Methylotuvimicrobium alcaliphilum (strain DSM 19304 / NCIMB 14124 / VKM B-2133 / 20Z) TaxID=1091494 RepID=G4SUU6_META2|nr:J domain-containing protein [Methylotuvimicrobium alcaliphilum]CCE24005.1 Heat shock protein DnaJ domain protein [Methylotuvimicrobium alcaliphilum 20Z]
MLPEEQELKRLETEEAELEEQVSSAELALETVKTEMAQFHYRYYRLVGYLYVEMDELDARIASEQAERYPDNIELRARAHDAEQQAQRSAEEAGLTESQVPPAEITPEIKQAYRKATKLMHPDRATNEIERERRTIMMARVNRAYEAGDLAAIEQLIIDFGQDSEAVEGSDTGARLVKVIRRIAQLRRRLSEAEQELSEQKQTELYELMGTVGEAEASGEDPLGDLARQLTQHISERKVRLELLCQPAN